MCRIRVNVTNMFQFITSNIKAYEAMDSKLYKEQKCEQEEEYYKNMYPLFTQYVLHLLFIKEPTTLDTVTSIFGTLYTDFVQYDYKKKQGNYIKHMATLCRLSATTRDVISIVAKTIWSGKTQYTGDTQTDICLKKIVAYDSMHKFIWKCKEEDVASFIKGKNVTVQRGINFLHNTIPTTRIAECGNDVRKLDSIIRIFTNATEVIDNISNTYENRDSDTDDSSYSE